MAACPDGPPLRAELATRPRRAELGLGLVAGDVAVDEGHRGRPGRARRPSRGAGTRPGPAAALGRPVDVDDLEAPTAPPGRPGTWRGSAPSSSTPRLRSVSSASVRRRTASVVRADTSRAEPVQERVAETLEADRPVGVGLASTRSRSARRRGRRAVTVEAQLDLLHDAVVEGVEGSDPQPDLDRLVGDDHVRRRAQPEQGGQDEAAGGQHLEVAAGRAGPGPRCASATYATLSTSCGRLTRRVGRCAGRGCRRGVGARRGAAGPRPAARPRRPPRRDGPDLGVSLAPAHRWSPSSRAGESFDVSVAPGMLTPWPQRPGDAAPRPRSAGRRW